MRERSANRREPPPTPGVSKESDARSYISPSRAAIAPCQPIGIVIGFMGALPTYSWQGIVKGREFGAEKGRRSVAWTATNRRPETVDGGELEHELHAELQLAHRLSRAVDGAIQSAARYRR